MPLEIRFKAPQFFRCAVAALLLWLSSWPAGAVEHVVERAYVEDPTGRWTLQQAQAQPLTPFVGLLTQGYGKSVFWVRLRIDPRQSGPDPNAPLLLRIRPIFLDDLRLFDQADDFAPRQPTGDRYPLAAQDEAALAYVLKLTPGSVPRDIWIRLESTSTRLAHFEVLDEPVLRKSSQELYTLGGIYLALMAVFTAVGFWQAISRRDALNWSFTFYQVMSFLYGTTLLGYMRLWTDPWLPAPILDRAFSVTIVFFIFGILLYSYFLAREMGPSLFRRVLYFGLTALFAVSLFMQLIGHVSESLQMNVIVGMVMPLAFLIDTLLYKRPRVDMAKGSVLGRRSIILYFSLTLVFAYLNVLPALGLLKAVELTIYSMIFYSLSSGLLMLGILQYRAALLLRQREELLSQARIANERAELERLQRLDRERLIAMLGHELKTPLATLRMMLGDSTLPQEAARQLSEPLQEINELIERTVQTGQLESDAIGLHPVPCRLLPSLQQPLAQVADAGRVHWRLHHLADETEVQADPFLLGVVVRNLIDNALKYSPEGSIVDAKLDVVPEKSLWTLEVCNIVGRAGFPDANHVFEKFWRSPKAGYRSGSGQGLFISWRLAQIMGGTLNYVPGDESVCFRLELPFHLPFQEVRQHD